MPQKIVFMGTPKFSLPTLEMLLKSEHKVLAVYTQPPRKSNRGQKVNPSDIEAFSKKHSLKLRTPENLNEDEEFNYLKKLKPDVVVVVAYGKIIPKRFLDLPKNGFINIHASLLPVWRGAAPIQRSIMNLDKETGISIMKIVESLDAGPVMQQEKISINENIDALTLSKVLSNLGAKSIISAIEKIEKGTANFKEQNHKLATYAKKISKKESRICWDENAKTILAKINGLNPNPGAWFHLDGERFKIWKAEIVEKKGEPGTIIDDNLTIACKTKSLKVLEIQKEGKSRQPIDKFILGNKIYQGTKLI
tara:strand:- start:354 stop:1274 length:921 start_codon:yes stop_codon:yes gene_type:complete